MGMFSSVCVNCKMYDKSLLCCYNHKHTGDVHLRAICLNKMNGIYAVRKMARGNAHAAVVQVHPVGNFCSIRKCIGGFVGLLNLYT